MAFAFDCRLNAFVCRLMYTIKYDEEDVSSKYKDSICSGAVYISLVTTGRANILLLHRTALHSMLHLTCRWLQFHCAHS